MSRINILKQCVNSLIKNVENGNVSKQLQKKEFCITDTLEGLKGPFEIKCLPEQGNKLDKLTKAFLGDTALGIEDSLRRNFSDAFTDIDYMFMNSKSVAKVYGRPKSALSITTKLEKSALKKLEKGNTSYCLDDGLKVIKDGIGTRCIIKSLPELKKEDIEKLISITTFNGKSLTKQQINLLRKYIYEEPIESSLRPVAFKLYREFSKPLIERHTKEVVNELTMGILAKRIKDGTLTFKQIETDGLLDKDLIKVFKKRFDNHDISPIEITEINNYRGIDGLPYFTDSQITQLNYAAGLKTTVKRTASSSRYSYLKDKDILDEYQYRESSKAIKASGYNTCQMNVKHSNGALGELQFKGQYIDKFGEYEHVAYDLRQGKNTLGAVYNDYAKAIEKLTESQYNTYNKYLESCYNYYHRLELGLPAKKPVLPKDLDSILSMDNMKALHEKAKVSKFDIGITYENLDDTFQAIA